MNTFDPYKLTALKLSSVNVWQRYRLLSRLPAEQRITVKRYLSQIRKMGGMAMDESAVADMIRPRLTEIPSGDWMVDRYSSSLSQHLLDIQRQNVSVTSPVLQLLANLHREQ